MVKITFLGAAESVTGSRFLIDSASLRILVDCGLFQERQFRSRDWQDFPVSPGTIKAVILTHAHLDHCGYLPRLLKAGFAGPVICTPPTAAIARLTLVDSARLFEEDAGFKRKRHEKEQRKGPFPELALYTVEDARKVFRRFQTRPYRRDFPVSRDITGVFHNAGHILGSSSLELRVRDGKRERILFFSGDLGRNGNPLLDPPDPGCPSEALIVEATYGNRRHEDYSAAVDRLGEIVSGTAAAGGNVVIPILAVERAEEVLYALHQLQLRKRIPFLPAYIDSPMAIDVLDIYAAFPDYLKRSVGERLRGGKSPFTLPGLKLTRTTAASKRINRLHQPAVIMAGSGMCTGGRIKHHLIHNISRPECTVLFTCYQASGTLGREILKRPQSVRILGQFYPVRARVEQIEGFSGHADRAELIAWLNACKRPPAKLFIVHAEKESAEELAAALKGVVSSQIVIPRYLEEYVL